MNPTQQLECAAQQAVEAFTCNLQEKISLTETEQVILSDILVNSFKHSLPHLWEQLQQSSQSPALTEVTASDLFISSLMKF